MTAVIVPLMLVASSLLMAVAWLGHIRYRGRVRFGTAVLVSWFLVLPEYVLNVVAIRWGQEVYSGGAMAALNLCSGVLCVALVSRWFLGERLSGRQLVGFAMMACAVVLVVVE